jgi:hypothetical protein
VGIYWMNIIGNPPPSLEGADPTCTRSIAPFQCPMTKGNGVLCARNPLRDGGPSFHSVTRRRANSYTMKSLVPSETLRRYQLEAGRRAALSGMRSTRLAPIPVGHWQLVTEPLREPIGIGSESV